MKFNNQGIQLNPSKAKLANSELVKEYNSVIDSIFSLYTVPAVNNYMRLVHSFNYKTNDYESLILGYLTYASARLYNVGLYERYEYKKLGYESMPDWYEQKRKLKNGTITFWIWQKLVLLVLIV